MTTVPWGFPTWGDAPLAASAADAAGDVRRSLDLALTLSDLPRRLGRESRPLVAALATLGSVDLTTARTAEPHLDALAIAAQAGVEVPDGSTWGVYAAASPGTTLAAVPDGRGGVVLSGTKPWCSLAGHVSHALVTASTGDSGSGLYAVDLRERGVAVEPGRWVAHGLRSVTTSTVTFEQVPARPVGEPGWYLRRPGFAWGGIGVAAVWFGGAAALAGALSAAAARRPPDQVALMHLGAVDVALHGCRAVLDEAATAIDAGAADGARGRVLAARVRSVVAQAGEQVLTTVGHALGPGPLAHDAEHAARVADLGLYLRQHHAERDLAALGALLLAGDGSSAPA